MQPPSAQPPPASAPPVQPQNWAQPPVQQRPDPVDPTGGLIPLKNPKALTSYYLGLFSIFPLFGIVLGRIAMSMGLQGLKLEKAQPQVKGGTHARIGIGCGALGFLMNLAFIILFIALFLDHAAKPAQ